MLKTVEFVEVREKSQLRWSSQILECIKKLLSRFFTSIKQTMVYKLRCTDRIAQLNVPIKSFLRKWFWCRKTTPQITSLIGPYFAYVGWSSLEPGKLSLLSSLDPSYLILFSSFSGPNYSSLFVICCHLVLLAVSVLSQLTLLLTEYGAKK